MNLLCLKSILEPGCINVVLLRKVKRIQENVFFKYNLNCNNGQSDVVVVICNKKK